MEKRTEGRAATPAEGTGGERDPWAAFAPTQPNPGAPQVKSAMGDPPGHANRVPSPPQPPPSSWQLPEAPPAQGRAGAAADAADGNGHGHSRSHPPLRLAPSSPPKKNHPKCNHRAAPGPSDAQRQRVPGAVPGQQRSIGADRRRGGLYRLQRHAGARAALTGRAAASSTRAPGARGHHGGCQVRGTGKPLIPIQGAR